MTSKFTQEDYFNFLKSFLPKGDFWIGLEYTDNNFRLLIEALSKEYKRMGDTICDFIQDFIPDSTENYLEEWEASLQIPDDCIPLADNDDDRRENILLKLRSLNIQNADDLQELATLLGFTLEVVPINPFPPYDVPFIPVTYPECNFIIQYKADFSSDPDKGDILQCLLEKITPAHVKILFV